MFILSKKVFFKLLVVFICGKRAKCDKLWQKSILLFCLSGLELGQEGRMKVVVEEALFVGVVLNFLILKISARVLRRKGKVMLFSALIGEIISLFAPLFHMHFMLRILLTILSAILMLSMSFDFLSVKSFALLFGVFLTATFVFGGACEFVQGYVGSFPLFVVAGIGVCVYGFCILINHGVFRRESIKKFVYKVKIKDKHNIVEEEGYLDSGNVLYDGISGQPIILVTFDVFHKIYKQITLPNFVMKRYDLSSIKNGHYIKINSVGKSANMLVFSVDEVMVGGDKCFKNAMLGLSFSGFEKSFGKNILLHCDMA